MKALTMMYELAAKEMGADELQALGDNLAEEAEELARQMDQITAGIACLVVEDGKTKTGAGSFQTPDSIFGLLCMVSDQFEIIASMLDVSGSAHGRARRIERSAE